MRKLALLAVPAIVAGMMVAACGGGSTKTIDVPGAGQVKVNTGDKPPSDFPSDFPIYDGAKYTGSVTTTEQGISGTYTTWETGDSADKVVSFYDNDAFKDGPWKKTATVNSGGNGAFISVERTDDSSKVGFITIASGDKTQIGIIVGKNPDSGNSDSGKETPTASSSDNGGSDESTPSSSDSGSATLPDEVTLSSDFPKDRVPLPADVRVTGTNSVTSSGSEVHQVELYSKKSADDLVSYFKTEMPKHDWALALSTDSSDGKFLTFAGSGDEVLSVTIAPADVSGYQVVTLLVTLSAS